MHAPTEEQQARAARIVECKQSSSKPTRRSPEPSVAKPNLGLGEGCLSYVYTYCALRCCKMVEYFCHNIFDRWGSFADTEITECRRCPVFVSYNNTPEMSNGMVLG